MEILLRHAVQWLGMKSSPAVQRPGVLDNEDLFIQDLAELEDDELGPSTLLWLRLRCPSAGLGC